MKIAFLVISIFLIDSVALAQTPRNSDKADLATVHGLWAEYFSHPCTGALSPLEPVLATDFVFIGPLGEVLTKSQFMKDVGGCSFVEVSSTNGEALRIYGKTAIVTGMLELKPIENLYPGEARFFRYTNVYIKEETKWRLAHTHLTRIIRKLVDAAPAASPRGFANL